VLRHLGVLDYAPPLAAAVDGRRLIPSGSAWEIGIRWGTLFAARLIREGLEGLGTAVSMPRLDYRLWWEGVLGPSASHMGEHHRTVGLTY